MFNNQDSINNLNVVDFNSTLKVAINNSLSLIGFAETSKLLQSINSHVAMVDNFTLNSDDKRFKDIKVNILDGVRYLNLTTVSGIEYIIKVNPFGENSFNSIIFKSTENKKEDINIKLNKNEIKN